MCYTSMVRQRKGTKNMTNTNTRTVEIEMSKGYSGKIAAYEKGYIALITGTDAQYGMARTFMKGALSSNAPFRKSKCQWLVAYELGIGLYERMEGGERTFITIFVREDGSMACVRCDLQRATDMALMMDDGSSYEDARIATMAIA